MSLLMKALQQAAQNRNPSGIDPAPTEGADGPALSFEPMAGRERPAGTGPEAWGGGFEAPRAGTAGRATATSGPSPGVFPATPLTRIQWILILGGLAGSLLGGYVYVEVNHPGLWHRGLSGLWRGAPATVAATPPASPIAPPASAIGHTVAPAAVPPPTGPAPDSVRPAVASGDPPRPTSPAGTVPSGVGSAPPAVALRQPAREDSTTPARVAPGTPPTPPMPSPTTAVGTTSPRGVAAGTSEGRGSGTRAMPPAPGGEEPGGTEAIRVTRSSSPPAVDPALVQGYEHLQAGRLEAAAGAYASALARQPGGTDALLGLAAVALARGEPEAARQLYQRVLGTEPRNVWAQAGWLSLLGQSDPVAAESQLRELIAREPSALLWSRLGALLAAQGRWPQAQQAYFQAHGLAPDDPDHAFNLAVSLERIAQPRLALGFLRTAVGLAEAGAVARFDLVATRERIVRLAESSARP